MTTEEQIELDDALEDAQDWKDTSKKLESENRQLKRALWLARAMRAETKYRFLRYMWHKLNPMAKPDKQLIEEIKKNFSKWAKVERKCRAKAEEYKEAR